MWCQACKASIQMTFSNQPGGTREWDQLLIPDVFFFVNFGALWPYDLYLEMYNILSI